MNEQRTYLIAEPLLPALLKKVERFAGKAEELSGWVRMAWLDRVEHYLADGSMIYLQRIRLRGYLGLDSGWRPVAKLEIQDGGNIIRSLPTFEGNLPQKYRDTGTECEHCQLNRRRKHIWVLWDGDETFKQVGTNCMTDFTGDVGITDILKLADLMLAFEKAVKGVSEAKLDEDTLVQGAKVLNLQDYLCRVEQVMTEEGRYFARTKAGHGEATADKALRLKGDFSLHKARVEAAIAWVLDIYGGGQATNDYQYNLLRVCSDPTIPFSQVGYAASVMNGYQKYLAQIVNTGQKPSDYVGVKGKRYHNQELTVIFVHGYDSPFGGSGWLNKFEDAEGNVLVWFTTTGGLDEGLYVLDYTVKDHEPYRGSKQTLITRCKIHQHPELEKVNGPVGINQVY